MADNTITVAVVAETAQATAGLDSAAKSVDKVGQASKTASTNVSAAGKAMNDTGRAAQTGAANTGRMADGIDKMGSKAGGVTSGLRDMSDAVAMAGFPGLAAGMQTAAVGFEAVDGAATLFAATAGMKLPKSLGFLTKAMNFLKASILTNPIFIIAAIIIAIGAAFVMAYQKCEGFRKVVDAVFKFIGKVISGFWNWLKGVFTKLGEILVKPFKAYYDFLIGLWAKIRTGFSAAIDFVKNLFNKLSSFFSGIIDKVKEIFSKVTKAITKPFKDAMDWVKSHFKLPSINLPFIGGGKSAPLLAPTVGRAAAGGRHTGPNAAGGITVVVNGPIDAHNTVRQLRKLFREDQARLGRHELRPVLT